jgi:hypothetical protein
MTPAELQRVTRINLKVGNHVIIEYSAIVGNLDIIGYSSELDIKPCYYRTFLAYY